MRAPLAISLLTITLGGCAVDGDDNGGPTPFDEDPPLSGEGETKGDAPTDLPDEGKADAVYPKQWNEIENEQSPVKSQGSRGVCSIFATTAQVENLFLHEAIHGKAVAQTEVRKAEEETRELDAIRALSDRELEIEAIKVLAERGHRALDPGPEEVVYAGEDVPPADVAMSIWLAEAREPCYDE